MKYSDSFLASALQIFGGCSALSNLAGYGLAKHIGVVEIDDNLQKAFENTMSFSIALYVAGSLGQASNYLKQYFEYRTQLMNSKEESPLESEVTQEVLQGQP
ncbi:hypothetical protein J4471_03085 [Candidatus Woesearchaeota archaeon]|nr:hypothetical protein [Candidatus Woesearchaeota archaeon]